MHAFFYFHSIKPLKNFTPYHPFIIINVRFHLLITQENKMSQLNVKVLIASLVILVSQSFAADTQLRAGAAKVDITPPLGLCWAFDDKPMVDIADPLYAKALVFTDNKTTFAIVSLDTLGIPTPLTQAVRDKISASTNIPPENLIVCATHTHYVPNIDKNRRKSKFNLQYFEKVVQNTAQAVTNAYKNLKPATISTAKTTAENLMYNRRTLRPDGSVVTSFLLPPTEPNLTFATPDPIVNVLRINDADNQMLASMINFGCHPTSAGYGDFSYIVSADYPHYATSVIEKSEDALCLFTLAPAGDTVVLKRGPAYRRKTGLALGGAALQALQHTAPNKNYKISALRKTFSLPLKDVIPEKSNQIFDTSKPFIQTEIQAFAIGNVYFLALPGEILVEISLEIKQKANLENLFIITLANDYIGYVCHNKAYDQGGYESGKATCLKKGAGQTITNQALQLLKELKSSKL
jgi:hypothetical protein